MFRLGIAIFALAGSVFAAGFTFNIGGAIASGDLATKSAAFVFRTEGCADPAKPRISGAAEGVVDGVRRSIALQLKKSSRPGVFAVIQNWPDEGRWVVVLKGACADENAGAIVPIGPHGFIRDSAKFLPRPATRAEIDASLKALAQGAKK